MKKLMKFTTLAALAFAGAASAAIAEGDCKAGSYGAGITVKYAYGKCIADIDADGDNRNDPLSIPSDKTVIVDSVHYDRSTSKTGKAQTVAFPFAVSKSCTVTGANFYEFDGNKNKIYLNSQSSGSKWVALLQNKKSLSTDGLTAYYPYVIEFTTKNSLFIDIGGTDCSMTFVTPAAANYSFAAPGLNGTWSLFSSVSRIEWAEGHEDLGFIYGFAGKQVGEADVGNFVKAAAGASVPPLRAYLKFVPSQNASQSRVLMKAAAEESEVALPEEIEVQFVSLMNAEEGGETPVNICDVSDPSDVQYGAITVKNYTEEGVDKKVACIDGTTDARKLTVSITEDVVVDSVVLNRTFAVGEYGSAVSTIMLPFDVPNGAISEGVQFYQIVNIVPNSDGPWKVYAPQNIGALQANTPYMVYSTKERIDISSHPWNNKVQFTMNSEKGRADNEFTANYGGSGLPGTWLFKGTYENIVWEDGNSDLGRIYGFSSKTVKKTDGVTDSISAGQFVKAAAGASVPPMRAYLQYNKNGVLAKGAADASATLSEEDLPSTIEVVFLDADGKVMSIGQMNAYTGEVKMNKDLWFDLKGRQFNKKPTIKGTYYNQGRKVIIK